MQVGLTLDAEREFWQNRASLAGLHGAILEARRKQRTDAQLPDLPAEAVLRDRFQAVCAEAAAKLAAL